jgi:hypothetical protein
METTGRFGWTARGVLYLVVALLVARVPATGSPREADQHGAFAAIADSPFGGWLLGVVGVGLAAFAAFRMWEAVGSDEKLTRRGSWAFSALVYANLSILAFGILLGRSSSGDGQRTFTARVLGWPGGPLLVAAAGFVVLGSALWFVRKGVRERFRHDIDEHAVPASLWPAVRTVGIVGWLGRGIVWSLVGWFLLRVAIQHDPSEPVGLDASLRALLGQSWGVVVIWVAVVGLAAYGLLCLSTGAWLDADAPSST